MHSASCFAQMSLVDEPNDKQKISGDGQETRRNVCGHVHNLRGSFTTGHAVASGNRRENNITL